MARNYPWTTVSQGIPSAVQYALTGTNAIKGVVYVQPYIPVPFNPSTACCYVYVTTTIPGSLAELYASVPDVSLTYYEPDTDNDWDIYNYPLDGLDINLFQAGNWHEDDVIAIVYTLNDILNGVSGNMTLGFSQDYTLGTPSYPKAIMAGDKDSVEFLSFEKTDDFSGGTEMIDNMPISKTIVLLCTMAAASEDNYCTINFQVEKTNTSTGAKQKITIDPKVKNNGTPGSGIGTGNAVAGNKVRRRSANRPKAKAETVKKSARRKR